MSANATIPFDIPTPIMDQLRAGGTAWNAHDYTTAKTHVQQALEFAETQHSIHGVLGAKHLRALIAFNECDDALSRRLHNEALSDALSIGYISGAASSLVNLALVDIAQGDFDSARARYHQAEMHYQNCGDLENAAIVTQILKDDDFKAVLNGVHRVSSTNASD